MRNKTNIVVGVLVFLLVMTSPIWLNFGKSASATEVSLDTPTINAMDDKKCIYDTEYMRETTWKSSINGRCKLYVMVTALW